MRLEQQKLDLYLQLQDGVLRDGILSRGCRFDFDGLCHFGFGKPMNGQDASLPARIGRGHGEAR